MRMVTVVALAGVTAMLALASAAGAAPPQPSSGAGTFAPPVLTNVREAGGNTFADVTQTGVISGTFDGTFVARGHLVIHKTGRANLQGTVTFTGVTPCGTGTVVFQANNRTFNGVGTGHSNTVKHSTNTANIHAVSDLTVAGLSFTYSGTYHCDS